MAKRKQLFADPTLPSEEQTFEFKCAVKLAEALRAKHALSAEATVTKWPAEFTKLLTREIQQVISDTLEWYCQVIGSQYVPQAYSAKTFRDKFDKIRTAMLKDPSAAVELDDEQQKIMDTMKVLNWPNGSDAMLPLVIQRSWLNYETFYAKFKLRLGDLDAKASTLILSGDDEQNEDGHRLRRLVTFGHWLLQMKHICSVRSFIEKWFYIVNEIVTDWQGWSGNLTQFTFNQESTWFHNLGQNWSFDYFHKSTNWNKLMKELNIAG